MSKVYYDSPIGMIEIITDDEAVLIVDIADEAGHPDEDTSQAQTLADSCALQLDEYFKGKRKKFDLPLKPAGTSFQKDIWDILKKIPYGSTESYGAVALESGRPKGSRCTGQAVGRNPVLIIVPCHRVISADGGIGGFSGGLWRKIWLLEHERNSNDVSL